MRCVIAAEPEALEIILANLRAKYPAWEFEGAADFEGLRAFAPYRPDVVLVSRFLSGGAPEEVLKALPALFPSSRVVLLVGVLNEQAKAYVRLARKYGLTDVVTGKLPGDRPYTVFTALERSRAELLELEDLEGDERGDGGPDYPGPDHYDEQETGEEAAFSPAPGYPALPRNTGGYTYTAPQEACGAGLPAPFRREPARGFSGRGFGGTSWPAPAARGRLVLVAANKGGVGKTTVAISLSLLLARSGVPVCLCDFDFAGPNVALFFDIKNRPGIEKLSGKIHVERYLRELLVRVGDNLVVLPGPMDGTVPYFEPGRLVEVVDWLSREYLVVGDTPPEYWDKKPWLEGLFPRADLILAVVDQSKFSLGETEKYVPKMLLMGADPGRIRIVCNRFSAKLASIRKVEAHFCAGLKVKKGCPRPRVIAAIPGEWEEHVKKSYRGEIAGADDPHSPWHILAAEVAKELGLSYRLPSAGEKKSFWKLFGKGGK